MADETDRKSERLRAEAEFQNQRVAAGAQGIKEARDRFYYLADSARAHYHRTLEDVAGQHVLVVGCSEGGVTPLARKGAAEVIGIDIADEAIERLNRSIEAEGLADRARAAVMDGENLDVAESSLDLICCAGVLHHLDVAAASKSWSRALKPTGRVTMLEPMAWNPLIALYRLLTPSMRTADEHPLKPVDIRLLREHFEEVTVHGYVLTSLFSLIFAYLPNVFSLKEGLLRVLEKLDRLLLGAVPFLNYFCWTSVIEARNPKKSA